MPLTKITGNYKIIGASPDGDSIRFYPDDPSVWARAGIVVKANAGGGVQLRLDAIDALETHYTPPGAHSPWHQPADLGRGAADALLDLLGFGDVARNDGGFVTSATPAQVPGYILTRFADKYGRAVAMAFPEDSPGVTADSAAGSLVYLDVKGLHASVNYQLLQSGWVYPTFYSKLYVDLRADLAAAAVAARAGARRLWDLDSTLSGFTVTSREQLTDDLVILPKLFRRLAEYLALDESGKVDLAGFPNFLAAQNDRLFTIPTGQATSLDTLIRVEADQVTLTIPPEQIIFTEG